MDDSQQSVSRRRFLKLGTIGVTVAGVAGVGLLPGRSTNGQEQDPTPHDGMDMSVPMPATNAEVDHEANGFNPTDILTDFDGGKVSTLPNGQTLREYRIVAAEKNIEIAPGLYYAAWTYNGRVPGPTIRAREGDRIRIEFANGTTHPHSMHFHGIHPGNMDGVFEQIQPGEKFIYEFDAEPFGLHLYHCHTAPLAKHLSKGLYGAFIIDPKDGWPKVDHERVMVMSGFDIDFDSANDFYVVNAIPFHYDKHPIKLKVNETVRIFLVNILEFDVINSFHLHANFFQYYSTGTSLTPTEYTDTIAQMQGQRGILEFSYKYPGKYMFHAHKTEFAELGWTGLFEVTEA
jgi:FtsP/CotA-like multicopper oxidase with cupredoxin domain